MTDEKFRRLVNLYLDREITPEDLQALQVEISSTSERLDTFREYIRLRAAEQTLFREATEEGAPLSRTRVPFDPVINERDQKRRFVMQLAGACAVIVLALAFVVYGAWPEDSPVENVPEDRLDALIAVGSPPEDPPTETDESFAETADGDSVVISLMVAGRDEPQKFRLPLSVAQGLRSQSTPNSGNSPYAGKVIEIVLPEDPAQIGTHSDWVNLRQTAPLLIGEGHDSAPLPADESASLLDE